MQGTRFTIGRLMLVGLGAALVVVATVAAQVDVTPASGGSWLDTTHSSFEKSSLGRIGMSGAGAGDIPSPGDGLAGALDDGLDIDGEDLYRYNCRSCHGARGRGLPPEILPLTGAIKATSDVLQHQLSGDSTAAEAAAERADRAVRLRLAEGGGRMPDFSHFSTEELDVLLGFLETMVGVPDAEPRPSSVRLPIARVGEHVVKGSCQNCHAATEATVARGSTIEPLTSLTRDFGLTSVMEINRHGVEGGNERSRGPSLQYFTETELGAAYVYLAAYPPTD